MAIKASGPQDFVCEKVGLWGGFSDDLLPEQAAEEYITLAELRLLIFPVLEVDSVIARVTSSAGPSFCHSQS